MIGIDVFMGMASFVIIFIGLYASLDGFDANNGHDFDDSDVIKGNTLMKLCPKIGQMC